MNQLRRSEPRSRHGSTSPSGSPSPAALPPIASSRSVYKPATRERCAEQLVRTLELRDPDRRL